MAITWAKESNTKASTTLSTVDTSVSIESGQSFLVKNSGASNILTVAESTGNLTITGDLAISGGNITSALTCDSTLTVTGASQLNSTLTVGVDDTGYDVKLFGATSGQYMLWDESADELVLAGDTKLSFHDAAGGENIIASSNGHLEINAGTTLDITAPAVDLNGTLDVSSTSTLTGLVTASAGVKLGNNIIYASDGGSTITLDTSDNVTILGDLTISGGNITNALTCDSTLTVVSTVSLANELSVDGATNAYVDVDRNASGNAGRVRFQTNGTDEYEVGLKGGQAGFHVTDGSANTLLWLDADSVAYQSTGTGTSNTIFGKNAGDSIASGGTYNTLFGENAGTAISTGDNNTCLGYGAGDALTTTSGNTYIGKDAGTTDAAGANKVGIGRNALYTVNHADSDGTVAVGSNSLYSLTEGQYNVAVGSSAGYTLADGDKNVFIGYLAGYDMTDGAGNILVGYNAGHNVTSGQNNIAIGTSALNTSVANGDINVAIGTNSLYTFDAGSDGTGRNVAIGYQAGYYVSTGLSNTFIGTEAGKGASGAELTGTVNTAIGDGAGKKIQGAADSNTIIGCNAVGSGALTGDDNTCAGYQSGNALTSGEQNTLIGMKVGNNITTGANNVMLGYNISASAIDVTYEIVIGTGVDTSNDFDGAGTETVRIGRASDYITCDFGENATWSHSSDIRIKKDIKNNELGLNFINNLRTVNYKKKAPSEYPEEFKSYDPNQTERKNPDRIHYGFIAQEVKEAMNKVGHLDFPMWSENKDGMQELAESELISPIIKAIQELSKKVEELENKE